MWRYVSDSISRAKPRGVTDIALGVFELIPKYMNKGNTGDFEGMQHFVKNRGNHEIDAKLSACNVWSTTTFIPMSPVTRRV